MRFSALTALTLMLLGSGHVAYASPEEDLAAASALYDAHKYGDAAEKLDEFVRGNPGHPRLAAAAWVLGRSRAELKQYPAAMAAFEKATGSSDKSLAAMAYLGLGESAVNAGQPGKAVPALETAIRAGIKPEQMGGALYLLGQADLGLKRYGPAEENLQKVLRDYANTEYAEPASYGLAVAAVQSGRLEVARDRLNAFVSKYRQSVDEPRARLMLAQVALNLHDYAGSRRAFETLMSSDRFRSLRPAEQAAASDGLIQDLIEMKDYDAAAPRLEDALRRLPPTDAERYRASATLGYIRYNQKNYDAAVAAYAMAMRSDDPDVASRGYYWSANALLALKRPAEAASRFVAFLARFPKHSLAPRAALKAAESYEAAGQTEQALKAYGSLAANYPGTPEAARAGRARASAADELQDPAQLEAIARTADPAQRRHIALRLGRVYLAAKKYPEAQAALQPAVASTDPSEAAEGNYLLGLALEAKAQPRPAASAFSAAVTKAGDAPWKADALSRLAWVQLDLKQAPAAETSAQAGLGLKPDGPVQEQLLLAMMQARLEEQKYDQAMETARQVIAMPASDESLASATYTQAWILDKLKRPAESRPLWEQVASKFSGSRYAPEADVRLGDMEMTAKHFEEARSRYASALMHSPNAALASDIHFKLGSALYGLERPAEAAAEFDAAATSAAGDFGAESLFWAGAAMQKAGKKSEAIDRFERLTSRYPASNRAAAAKVRLAALKAVKE